LCVKGFTLSSRPQTPHLNHPKHITHILKQNPRNVGVGVDVVFGVVGEAGADHEVEVLQDGIQAFRRSAALPP
jgi:hypothetical protein